MDNSNNGLLGGKKGLNFEAKPMRPNSGEEELEEPRKGKEEWKCLQEWESYWKAKCNGDSDKEWIFEDAFGQFGFIGFGNH